MIQTERMIIEEWRLSSATGIGEMQVKSWAPSGQPRLILHIIHGMSEHMERYSAFARFLVERDVLCIACDLPGHGRSAPDEKHLGYFANADGWKKVLLDLHKITEQIRDRFPTVPVAIFGHSMGSFFARQYGTIHGKKLAGLILSGTTGHNPILPIARFLAAWSVRRNGAFHRDFFLDKLMHRGFLTRVENPKSNFDWLSCDPSVVKAYDADPWCGFPFTAAGFRDLFNLLLAINGKPWADRVTTDLPIRLMSGEDDPVGGYGIGVKSVYDLLKKTGHQDVEMLLYPSGRHEMLNEINRETVHNDILMMMQPWMAERGQV